MPATAFTQHYASVNVWAERMDKLFSAGAIGFSHHAIPDRELRPHRVLRWMACDPTTLPIAWELCSACPTNPPHCSPVSAPVRRVRSSKIRVVFFRLWFPHLERALSIHLELFTPSSGKASVGVCPRLLRPRCDRLGANGMVRFFNREAEHLLNRHDGNLRSRRTPGRGNCSIERRPAGARQPLLHPRVGCAERYS